MQYSLLIEYWLRKTPAGDPEAFAWQVAEAQWLEKRYFEALSRAVSGGK